MDKREANAKGITGKRGAVVEIENEASSSKKLHLNQDENEENEDVYDNSGSSSHSGEGDDEYYVDSDNEEGYDSAEDSSDIEDNEDHTDTCILSGCEINMKSSEDGKYCLLRCPSGKELKLIAPQSDVSDASASLQNCFAQKKIPIYEASGIDVTHHNEVKVIAYCERLKLVEKEYIFSNVLDDSVSAIETIVQENNVGIIMLQNMDMYFSTTDLL